MDICLVTGSAGLIGSETVRFFATKGFQTVGIDNDMRALFFGNEASILWNLNRLKEEFSDYIHHHEDIRDISKMERLFHEYGKDIKLVVHTAAQPSHDWAANDPATDFSTNAIGTLNLLETTRKYCPKAVFVFTSTNKVYGDTPNRLPLVEKESRFEIDPRHPYAKFGIDETMTIDQSLHSIFGASKVAADVLVQEYGRYFGLQTVCFRGGCLTGPGHRGAKLHGFLSYLTKCATTGQHYEVLGYKGKQVRDNIHSYDFVNAIYHFFRKPRPGQVYNIGGGRFSNCSILEAIKICEEVSGTEMNWSYSKSSRNGDHVWWISDVRKFQSHYPDWKLTYDIRQIIEELCLNHTGQNYTTPSDMPISLKSPKFANAGSELGLKGSLCENPPY